MKSLTTNRPDADLKARGTAPAILNISTYKFVQLDGLEALRASLLERCVARGLKGTVLLAPEGINVFLAGSRAGVHAVLDWLREDTRFVDLEPKESWSHGVPFKRMRVRLKREIITMNRPLIKPHAGRAPAVAPATVRQWLDQGHDDEGRRVLMLDTRNTFEIDVGTFDGAIDWRISKFSEFPPLAERHAGELAPYRVVSFCTGGIRCEKAAIVLQEAGVPHAVQLDGGILKYLELEGKPHWKGECFVFDERAALDAELQAAIDVAVESRSR